ncbi:MAG TPA: hypothetical protein VNM90_12395, partial [Haliangium sp.]|nr:hypothetical protein [Haliangium sp.]
MPRSTFHVLVLLALWLLPACRTVPNEAYCERSEECRTPPEQMDWVCSPTLHVCEKPTVGSNCENDMGCNSDAPFCD